jgi:hypothetical protein
MARDSPDLLKAVCARRLFRFEATPTRKVESEFRVALSQDADADRVCSKSRLRKMRSTSERRAMFPITFKRASRQHDSSSRASGSRKSPSAEIVEAGAPFRRLHQPSGMRRRLTLPLNIAPNLLRRE